MEALKFGKFSFDALQLQHSVGFRPSDPCPRLFSTWALARLLLSLLSLAVLPCPGPSCPWPQQNPARFLLSGLQAAICDRPTPACPQFSASPRCSRSIRFVSDRPARRGGAVSSARLAEVRWARAPLHSHSAFSAPRQTRPASCPASSAACTCARPHFAWTIITRQTWPGAPCFAKAFSATADGPGGAQQPRHASGLPSTRPAHLSGVGGSLHFCVAVSPWRTSSSLKNGQQAQRFADFFPAGWRRRL